MITIGFLISEKDLLKAYISLSGFTRSALRSFSKIQQSMQDKAHSPGKARKDLLALHCVLVAGFDFFFVKVALISLLESQQLVYLLFTLFISTWVLSVGEHVCV